MFDKQDKRRLKGLLLDTIRMMCKNGLPADSSFRIEATIGVSMSNGDTMVISFKERIQPDGSVIPQMWSDDEEHVEDKTDIVKIDSGEIDDSELDSVCRRASKGCEMSLGKRTDDDLPDDFSTIHSFSENQLLATDPSKYLMAEKMDGEGCSYVNSSECSFDDTTTFATDSANRRVFSASRQSLSFGEPTNENNPVFVKLEASESHENSDDVPTMAGKQKMKKARTTGRMCGHSSVIPANSSVQFRRNMYTRQTTSDRSTFGNTSCYRRKVSSSRSSSLAGGQLCQARAKGHSTQSVSVARTISSFCRSLAEQAGTADSETDGHRTDYVFCHICGARLSSTTTLANHIRGTHLSMSTCQCDICGESFKWTMQLTRHRRRFHPETGDMRIQPDMYCADDNEQFLPSEYL